MEAYHDGPALRGRCGLCGAQATHNEGGDTLRCYGCCQWTVELLPAARSALAVALSSWTTGEGEVTR